MKRLAAAILMFASALATAARDLPSTVREALARSGVPLTAVGAVVMPLERGAPLIAHNADEPMNPASAMKLVTAFAALDILGPAFTFHTDFLSTAEPVDGVLDGDLAIRGGGDPKLTADRLWLALHELRARGVREIRGDIVIDRSYFAPAEYDPGRFDNEPRRAYNVGPDAFLLNFHAIQFRFIPSGTSVRIAAEPDLPNIEMVSRIHPVPGPCGGWRESLKQEFVENGLIGTLVFSGSYPAECGEKTWSLSLFDSERFSEAVLRWVLSESGVTLRGKVRAGPVPAEAKLLMRIDSEPLSNLTREMNKFSNNVIARHLFLALSAERDGRGDAATSARRVRELLESRGIDTQGFSIENGAGLSRDDRITARALATLLRSAWASPVMPEMASSMPIFGTDGTLKSRRNVAAAGHAHLKGGTLTGVQSVAGYVLDAGGQRWIVVMMLNHPRANAAQSGLDAMVEWVHEQGGERRMPR